MLAQNVIVMKNAYIRSSSLSQCAMLCNTLLQLSWLRLKFIACVIITLLCLYSQHLC